MFYINPEKLIKAVKMRPGLYKTKANFYKSHKRKDKIWREVAKEIHENWNQLNQQHKVEYVREIRKCWQNLRTSFTRELKWQRKENIKQESDQHIKKRKRCEYFNDLLFLTDTTDPFDSSSSEPEEIISDYGESSSDVKNAHTMKTETIPEQNYPQPQVVCERNNTLEEKVLDMLKDIKNDEDDEDRQFMLSLVSTLRKLNAKQKSTARIEILKVLQNILFEKN
ncbi:unnamed protein product [Euphydryas editha]|uniref:MADF domain-containing protein n=1 Tax=Euphydryas editha TaxID=104508 RepID=A0AAU9U6B1_EUPED|nr:unnamed protein product [Euphydryas editha]